MHLFIFGLGYSSLAIAQQAMARGYTVSGTTRSAEKAAFLRGMGIEVFLFSPSPRRGEGWGEGGVSYAPKPTKYLTDFSRKLRQDQTDVEKLLWYKLRNRQIAGVKFRRQEVIGNYIVDFLAPEKKLIIELDGGQHNESAQDAVRDAYLLAQGYRILRFWNNEVLQNTEGVLLVIFNAVGEFPPHPGPLPVGEREIQAALAGTTHILSSIPPQETGDIVLPFLPSTKHQAPSTYFAYLSTTGVYGDWQGAWVDEASELRPNSERLHRRIEAEKQWLARGGHVFRLAGIYGPGRSVLEDIRAGTARRIDKPQQVFSRIHVEDIAQTILASMEKPNPGNVYNVCDDEPAPAHEVVAYGCGLLGVKPPPLVPFEKAELSVMGREFYAANRRVKNAKIKQELGVRLRYPDYRQGLAQCLQRLQTE